VLYFKETVRHQYAVFDGMKPNYIYSGTAVHEWFVTELRDVVDVGDFS
jgi:hypothetical protein